MSSTQFWVGALVPPLIKWANPYLKKIFEPNEFDTQTRERITVKQYPIYYAVLYGLWVMALLSTGLVVLVWFMISGPSLFPDKSYAVPVFLGFINMIGVWFIGGAMLDFLFWQLSPENFRDYVKFRQLKSGWGYDIKQQVITLIKLGIIYYVITSPVMLFLLK